MPENLGNFKVPARINHQLIYSDSKSPLAASINVSLHHENSIPITKKLYDLDSNFNNRKYETRLAICDSYIDNQERVSPITLDFYSNRGLIKENQ